MKKIKQFSFSFDEENFNGIFDTVEECLEEAKNEIADDIVDENEDITEVDVWVGEIKEPSFNVDAQNVLEWIEEDFYEQCGEHADGWLSSIKQSEINLLSDRFKSLVEDWMIETNNFPMFYSVENVKKYIIENELNK